MQNNEANRNEHLANGSSSRSSRIKREALTQPNLEELKNFLANELMLVFENVVVKLISCPSLTSEPYNLAGRGLHGNTTIIECNTTRHEEWNMVYYFINFLHDSFLIGGGFGAKPSMPFNGYLVMNATFKQPIEINNASRLFAIRSNGQERMEDIDRFDRMTICATGNFFMSEGREGRVLEIRAKKRKDSADIITMIKNALNSYSILRNEVIGLGGVLLINKGTILISVIPEDIPEDQIMTSNDLIDRTRDRHIRCKSTITTLGTIVSEKINSEEPRPHHYFYTFSENNVGGRFVNDITPNETEYVGYFNVAQYIIEGGPFTRNIQ